MSDVDGVLFSTIPETLQRCIKTSTTVESGVGSLRGVSDCNTAIGPCRPQFVSGRSKSTIIPHLHPQSDN